MKKMMMTTALILTFSVFAHAQNRLRTLNCSGELDGSQLQGSAQVTPFGPATIDVGQGVTVEIQQPSICGTACQTTRITTVKVGNESVQSSLSYSTQEVEGSKITFPGIAAKLNGKSISIACNYEVAPRKKGSVKIDSYQQGLFPAPIETHMSTTVVDTVTQEIQSKCGTRQVTDLSLKVELKNNQTPGTANLRLTGEAVCP